MKKYKVYATMTTTLYLIVEAKDQLEAIEIAKQTDGGDFIEDEGSGSFDISYVDEIPEKTYTLSEVANMLDEIAQNYGAYDTDEVKKWINKKLQL